MLPDPFAPVAPDAVAVGTGRLTLDVIVRSVTEMPAPPRSQAGGTCGNVLANLAYLGWQAFPLTDLGDDDPGRRFCNDLQRWGTHLDLIRWLPGEQTPVIIHHIRETDDGAVHSFSSRCPFCGGRLRYYEPLPVESVRQRLPLVPDARACFFDRDSEGALLLARHCAGRGALVVFEPNYAGKETLFPSVLPVVHVLKYARDKLPDLENRFSLAAPLLVVETLGADGLRYRDQRNGPGQWQHLPAFRVEVVRDAGGSGDWCTAGLIHLLGRDGLAGFRSASADDVAAALRFGQALAAWNCAFEGARGAVYAGDKSIFEQAVRRILQGQPVEPPAMEPVFDVAGDFCPRCGGKPPTPE
jgi:sugar/nucleoside kinase (ribokinase family)